MRTKLVSLIVVSALRVMGQGSNWQAAANLPDVDWKGLTPAQQQAALKLLREEGCGCGCGMKVVQCRVEDPKCSVSKGMAANATKGFRAGKNAADVKASLGEGTAAPQILEPAVAIPITGEPVKGPATARITLVEFSDFECPYCSHAMLQLEAIQKAFPNDVRLVFKQFPLAALHPRAMLAAQAALAAHAQGKFWPLHDKMFQNRTKLTRDNILQWAKDTGCDMKRFQADMDSAATKQLVARDLKQGEAAGVEGTPSVYVNGKHYNGSMELAPFSAVLKEELQGGTVLNKPASKL